MRDLARLPKAHLHVHLEGAMRPETLQELATRYDMAVPEIRGYGSFSAFADMYVAACDVLRSPEDVVRMVDEVVEDAKLAGAVWVEPSTYIPHHRVRLGPPEQVLEMMLDAMASATARYGIGGGLIVSADRTLDPADAVEQAKMAVRYRDMGVIGFGLANDEVGYPPEPFAPAFAVAKEGGLLSIPHAGELVGPESITAALDHLGADRIQHGVRAVEQPDLVARLADSGVCCDVCPTSNVLLSVVPTLADHALPVLLDAGVRCSVNGDDPLLFGPGLLEEYEVCRTEMGFDDARMATIARCSIEASAAPANLKGRALAGIDDWLAAS